MSDTEKIHSTLHSGHHTGEVLGDGAQALQADQVLALQRQQDQAIARRLEQLGITPDSYSQRRPAAAAKTVAPAQTTTAGTREPQRQTPHSSRLHLSKKTLRVATVTLVMIGAALLWLLLGVLHNTPLALPSATAPTSSTSGQQPDGLMLSDAKVSEAANVLVPEAFAATDGAEDLVRQLIERWRMAWQQRDIERYLDCYSTRFVPANGLTREAWSQARQRSLSEPKSITVQVKELHFERLDEQRYKVTFLQDYATRKHQERDLLKTLLIERTGLKWQIAGEWKGDQLLAKKSGPARSN